jgi:hypothetical protein
VPVKQDLAVIELRWLVAVAVLEYQEAAGPVPAGIARVAVRGGAERDDLFAHDGALAREVDGVKQRVDFHALGIAGLERGERGQAEREDHRGDRDCHQELEE